MNNVRRLIDYFIPENYRLHLDIDKLNRTFEGNVTISGQPIDNQIRLHSVDLEIISVRDDDGDIEWELTDNELVINKPANRFTVQFAGHISDTAMNGLYLSKYKLDGKNYELFATQFESHYTRQCFPCIDEPAAKATFDVSIRSADPSDTTILSNMPGTLNGDTWVFEQTPRMSTYLLAFVGGNLHSKSATTKNGIVVNTYATPDQPAEHMNYALATAVRALDYYQDYFNLPYPLPKLDNVAIPDFSAGAMENWGLITYRQTAMLVKEDAAQNLREFVATVVAHEIAHQWFGNLVTMNWWDDLWLNESFASLMENMAVDHLYPDYNIWQSDLASSSLYAKSKDSLAGVQSVRQDVNDVDEIATLFDAAIVYAKGQRLLDMLYHLIGDKAFRLGLSDYFHEHAYTNTTAIDLWNAWTKYAKIDVAKFMEPWLNQPGLPVLSITDAGDHYLLKQSRLSSDKSHDDTTIWPIPLFGLGNDDTLIMDKAELKVYKTNQTLSDLNKNGTGYYVLNYDQATLDQLLAHFDELPVRQKINTLHDIYLLIKRNISDITPLVNTLKNIRNLSDKDVIDVVSSCLSLLIQLPGLNSPTEEKLRNLAKTITEQQLTQLLSTSIEQLNDRSKSTFATTLGLALYGRNNFAEELSDKMYHQFETNIKELPDFIRYTILRNQVVRNAGSRFNSLYKLLLNTNDSNLQDDLRSALAASPRKADADILLNSIRQGLIRPQDVIGTLASICRNRHTSDLAWHWIRSNWDWIDEIFSGDASVADFVSVAAIAIKDERQLAEYDRFFAKLNSPALARAIITNRNAIVETLRYIQTNAPILEKILD